MIVKHVTVEQMESALAAVNKQFENNVQFNRFQPNGSKINFTLRVKDSHKPGHRRGFTGKRMASACWHVHGTFFDALLGIEPQAVIISRGGPGARIDRNGGNWQDCNIGSQFQPMMFSGACDCGVLGE